MRNLSVFTALTLTLLGSFASAHAAAPLPSAPPSVGPSNAPAQHPIVGSWTWKLPGKACTETYEYRANGSRAGSSGEEIVQGSYEISPLPSLLGFHRLIEIVTTGNGKRDCSGDLHEAASPPDTHFIQFNPKRDQVIVCKAESLQACFGPLKRAPN